MKSLVRNPVAPYVGAALLTAVLTAAGATSFALAIAPTLALLAHLAAGRFPAERLVARLSGRRSRHRLRPGSRWRARRPGLVRIHGPRGGLLIAAGLSSRAPPLGI